MATDVEAPPLAIEPDDLYEVVDGRVLEKTMGATEADIANLLKDILAAFAAGRRLGRVHMETLFLLDPERGLRRRPDVAFVSHERWPVGRRVRSPDAWKVVPDLAIEVVSPSNSASEVIAKVGDYFRVGVREVWVIYPVEQLAQVFESATASRIVHDGGLLASAAILPGFELPLATLFEDEEDGAA